MAQRLIPLNVENEHVIGSGVNVGAAASHDAIILELHFSEMWQDLTKRILWIDARGENHTETVLTAEMALDEDTYHVPIPATPLAYPGKMSMTITGVFITGEGDNAVETVRVVTEAAYFRVMESYADALTLSDIDPTIAEQLQAEIDTILEDILDAREAAKDAEAWAIGKRGGVDVEDTDETYHNNAKYYALGASASAVLSESWAIGGTGEREGEDTDNAKHYSEEAESSAGNASDSATDAAGSATLAESWAHGNTGARAGENTDNAKYWAEQAQQAAGGGVTSFNGRAGSVLPTAGDYTSDMVGAVAEDAQSTVTFSIGCDANGFYVVTPDDEEEENNG